ncbi:MAG: glycosyltransferase [Lachnospiraceae bacterium]|nr:glycosyltransferase [Lachnospiraceae bacterium]
MISVIEVIPALNMGGAETMVKDYCLLIDRQQFDISVIVLTEHTGTPIEKELEESGVRVIYLGEQLFNNPHIGIVKRAIRRIHRYYSFRKAVLSLNPDVIHIHLQIGKYMRVLPLKKMRVKLFLTVHNVTERFFSKDKGDRVKNIEYKEVNRLIHGYGLTLISLHDGLNKELRDLFDTDRVITVNNGIRLDRFNPELYNRTIERDRIGIKGDFLVIGHVGSMHPQKNHDLILDIFEELHKNIPNSQLLLIGKGELKEHIMKRINDLGIGKNVTILSDRDDVPQLMACMDVFLFPSRWEGFGNVLIEAQCMGLPCVVSDAISDETRITDMVHVVSLDAPIKSWIGEIKKTINGQRGKYATKKKIDYDMAACIKRLETIYR